MHDYELAYEQNVTGLEKAWAERIERFAQDAVERLAADYPDAEHITGLDIDHLQLAAADAVAARLLDSVRWENVKATDISDIAYEAVGRVLDAQR